MADPCIPGEAMFRLKSKKSTTLTISGIPNPLQTHVILPDSPFTPELDESQKLPQTPDFRMAPQERDEARPWMRGVDPHWVHLGPYGSKHRHLSARSSFLTHG